MTAPACSDQEFIQTWRDLQSASKVADAIGVKVRNVCYRRKNIEKKYGLVLPVSGDRTTAYNTIEVSWNRAVIRYRVKDGVILIGSDAHIWPGPLNTVQKAFIKFAKTLKPKALVANGDFFDGASISRHPSIGWEKKPTVQQELEAVQAYVAALEKAAPGADRFWTAGNHDLRFESRLAAMAPEYRGVHGIHLKDHFPRWKPCWRIDVNDDLVIRHRELGGEHADFNNVVKGGKSIVTGHDHRLGSTPYVNYAGLKYGIRTGMMADSAQDEQFVHYLEAKEPNWHSGFVVLTFREGRLMEPEVVRKWGENAVQFRGEVISV